MSKIVLTFLFCTLVFVRVQHWGLTQAHRMDRCHAYEHQAGPKSKSLSTDLRLRGGAFCKESRRNPGSAGSLEKALVSNPRASSFLTNHFQRWLLQPLGPYTGLDSLVHAVWTGDVRVLPLEVKRIYVEGGILQLLALSGQHVMCLVRLIQPIFGRLVRWLLLNCSFGYSLWSFLLRFRERAIPFLCSLLLVVVSGAAPSMVRTTFSYGSVFLLSLTGLRSSSLQITCSSIACALVFSPNLAWDVGFVLSSAGALFLCLLLSWIPLKSVVGKYVVVCGVMPLFFLPLGAMYFGKVAWLSVLCSLGLTWLWECFVIPMGFLLPFVARWLPSYFASAGLQIAETIWSTFLASHSVLLGRIGCSYRNAIRLWWWECLLIELILILFLQCVFSRYRSRKS